MKLQVQGEEIIEVEIDLFKSEIQMLIHCIGAMIDTKHVRKQNEEVVKEIRKQLSKYL